jgi:hypothetical protein
VWNVEKNQFKGFLQNAPIGENSCQRTRLTALFRCFAGWNTEKRVQNRK